MTALHEFAEQLKTAGAISAEDTLALRRELWPDGRIALDEAELVFALNDSVANSSREWVDFYVEALCDYVVCQQSPRGYVDEAKAEWLVARIARDGKVESLSEFELLVKVLECATAVPESLKAFALAQIERAVIEGEGPTRDGGTLGAGMISASECKLLRRLVFAQAGDSVGVSKAEAELLFRIKDATLGAENAPEWKALFVQGVGNHLMAYNRYAPLTRDAVSRLDAFMGDSTVRIGGFLSRMAQAGATGAGFRAVEGAKPVDHEAELDAAQAVTPDESAWLKGRLDADEAIDPLEQALLDFIAEEQRAG